MAFIRRPSVLGFIVLWHLYLACAFAQEGDQTCALQTMKRAPKTLVETCQFNITFSWPTTDNKQFLIVDAYKPEVYHYQDVFKFNVDHLDAEHTSCPIEGKWMLRQVNADHLIPGATLDCRPDELPFFTVRLVDEERCRPLVCVTDGTETPYHPEHTVTSPAVLGYFSKGINTLSGDAVPTSGMASTILTWYWKKAHTINKGYNVQEYPDELLAEAVGECDKQSDTTEVSQGTTSKAMSDQAISRGVTANVGVIAGTMSKVPGLGFLSKGEESSLQFRNSDESKLTQERSTKGMSKHFTTRVLYKGWNVKRDFREVVSFSPAFYESMRTLSGSSEAETFGTIKTYGTAVLEKVILGATYDSSAYFYDNQSTEAISQYQSSVHSGETKIPLYTSDTNNKTSTIDATESSYQVKGEWVQSRSFGKINVHDGACNGLPTSSEEIMVPIQYSFYPLVMLPCVQSLPAATAIADFMSKYAQAARECGDTHCSRHGACGPNSHTWQTSWFSYDYLLDENICTCDDFYWGAACNKQCPTTFDDIAPSTQDESCRHWNPDKPYCYKGDCFATCTLGDRSKCSNHGSTSGTNLSSPTGCTCTCDTYWEGQFCEVHNPSQLFGPCSSNDDCYVPEGLGHGVCVEGKCRDGAPCNMYGHGVNPIQGYCDASLCSVTDDCVTPSGLSHPVCRDQYISYGSTKSEFIRYCQDGQRSSSCGVDSDCVSHHCKHGSCRK